MGIVLKLHCAQEQVSSILEPVSQWIQIIYLQKAQENIIVQTLVALSKTMDSIFVAFSAVELWHFSQEFHDTVSAVCNISKLMEHYQIFSGGFLVNLRQDSFKGRMSFLALIWCIRDILLLCLLVSSGTGKQC